MIFLNVSYARGLCSGENLTLIQDEVTMLLNGKDQLAQPWEALRAAFEGKRECMFIYETYMFSETIAYFMLEYWEQINMLNRYSTKDPSYFQFVLSALSDETANIEDINKIRLLAETKCPEGAESLCLIIINESSK
jgi:hypothetical protein